jgi:hypothetical protein
MRQHFLIALALLLGVSSVGHVLAAAFCPHLQGRECCVVKSTNTPHASGCNHEDAAMSGMDMSDVSPDKTNADSLTATRPAVSDEEVAADKFEEPFESCAHCLGHSALINAPVAYVTVPDQSNKIISSAPAVPAFLVPSVAMRSRVRLPQQHAPPGRSASRHLLINVFLI